MLLLQCLSALLLAVVCASSDDIRNDPRLPIQGTRNWELLKTTASKFSPRHSHATTIFLCPDTTDDSECIWLTGGYSDEHRSYNGEKENENADVWYSKDGKDFTQVRFMVTFTKAILMQKKVDIQHLGSDATVTQLMH